MTSAADGVAEGAYPGVAGAQVPPVSVPAVVPDDVVLARAYLSRVAEPASVALWLLVREVGPIEASERVYHQKGIDARVAKATEGRHADVNPYADLEAADRRGIRLVVPESEDWPHFGLAALEHAAQLRALTFAEQPYLYSRRGEPMPPLALWVAGPGSLATLGTRSVGLVGSRTATTYGEHVARTFGRHLAERDVTVVSGGAYGIDAAAHNGALDVAGDAVLISAGGLDTAYPRVHQRLFDRVRDTGVLLSESPPGRAPTRIRFLTRNRLIAALSTGTVIVEAAARSGALNTARHCVALGRPLMAVPGPIGSAQSAGCHIALRRPEWDTTLVTSAEEILDVVGGASDLAPQHPSPAPANRLRRVLDTLDESACAVFDGLPAGRSIDVDELVHSSGRSVSEVLRSLPVLELAGLIEADRDGFRITS